MSDKRNRGFSPDRPNKGAFQKVVTLSGGFEDTEAVVESLPPFLETSDSAPNETILPDIMPTNEGREIKIIKFIGGNAYQENRTSQNKTIDSQEKYESTLQDLTNADIIQDRTKTSSTPEPIRLFRVANVNSATGDIKLCVTTSGGGKVRKLIKLPNVAPYNIANKNNAVTTVTQQAKKTVRQKIILRPILPEVVTDEIRQQAKSLPTISAKKGGALQDSAKICEIPQTTSSENDLGRKVATGRISTGLSVMEHDYSRGGEVSSQISMKQPSSQKSTTYKETNSSPKDTHDIGCSTDITTIDIFQMKRDLEKLREDCLKLRESMALHNRRSYASITEHVLENNDAQVIFHTGLQTYAHLSSLFHTVCGDDPPCCRSSLSKFQEIIVVLMKLRLGLVDQDLAYRFGVTLQSVIRTFSLWLPVMAAKLKSYITDPPRKSTQIRPQIIEKVTLLMDFLQVSVYHNSDEATNIGHFQTINFLIGFTPAFSICFISKASHDKDATKMDIIQKSGILNLLQTDDMIIGDWGGTRGVALARKTGTTKMSFVKPASPTRFKHLSGQLKKAIFTMKQKFLYLSVVMPPEMRGVKNRESLPLVDHIVNVCCSIINLCMTIPNQEK